MKALIILAALVVVCSAAPTPTEEEKKKSDTPLERPSPVNPDVQSEPKPDEKITLITDPKEIAKYEGNHNQESTTHLLPTVTPNTKDDKQEPEPQSHYIFKRDHKAGEAKTDSTSVVTSTTTEKPSEATRNRRSVKESETTPSPTNPTAQPPSSPPSSNHHSKREAPEPLANDHNEKPAANSSDEPQNLSTKLPEHSSTIAPEKHTINKRDIPVPVTAKGHHSEESHKTEPKDDKEAAEIKTENEEKHHSTNPKEAGVQVKGHDEHTRQRRADKSSHEEQEVGHNQDKADEISTSSSSSTTEHSFVRPDAVSSQ